MNFVIKELAVWIMLISSIAMINLFVIVLIVIYDGVKQLFKNSKSIKLSKPCPAISIIIPTYNEEGSISSCLDSLVNSDYPKIQIVVADDRSSDSTIDIVKNYQKIYSNIVLYRGKKHLGKSLVLNAVTDSIPNEYIFFVDADVTLTKEFFTNSMLEFVNSKSDYIVPNIYIRNPSNVMQAFQYIEFAYLNLLRMASVRLFEVPFYFNGCAFGIKKSVLKKVGGFAL